MSWCDCVYTIPHPNHVDMWFAFQKYIAQQAYKTWKENHVDREPTQ